MRVARWFWTNLSTSNFKSRSHISRKTIQYFFLEFWMYCAIQHPFLVLCFELRYVVKPSCSRFPGLPFTSRFLKNCDYIKLDLLHGSFKISQAFLWSIWTNNKRTIVQAIWRLRTTHVNWRLFTRIFSGASPWRKREVTSRLSVLSRPCLYSNFACAHIVKSRENESESSVKDGEGVWVNQSQTNGMPLFASSLHTPDLLFNG